MRYVWNPHDFRPVDFLPPALRRQGDAARVLVHLIEYRRLDKRHRDGEWVTLQAKYLRNVIGVEHCEAVRDALADRGVITVRRDYSVGRHSFRFRIGPLFEHSPFRRFPVVDRFLVGRMARHLGRSGPDPASPTDARLYHWLRQLSVDAGAARRYVAGCGAGADETRQKLLTVDMLAEGDWHYTRDRHGRVHTNFTSLWSRLRWFLSVAGEPIVEMDIGNSQPLFFGLLALAKCGCSHRWPSDMSAGDGGGRPNTLPVNTSLSRTQFLPPPSPSLYDAGIEPTGVRRRLPPDLDTYLTLVERGDFYEYLMDKARLGRQGRDRFKESFFARVFYATTQRSNALSEVFRREFPTAFAVLAGIRAGDPRDAPRRMQQLEADFVIDTCCRKLLAADPGVPILTLHDGVWTTPAHLGLVRRTFEAEFARLGVRPLLRTRAADGSPWPP